MIMDLGLFVLLIRIVITFISIAFITPQTFITYYDYVLTTVHATRFFVDYPTAEKFVIKFTWLCIFLYSLVNILLYF